MKLPSQRKILREDLKDAPSWINGIIDPLNSFMQMVYQALNKNINEDNLASQIKEITYKTPASYPIMEVIEFQSILRTKAVGCSILQIVDKNSHVPALGPCYAPWVDNNGAIQIYPITGLEPSRTYIVRLRIV